MAAMTAIHPSKREGALARAKRRLAALAMSTVDRFETYLRYAGASAVALGADILSFAALVANDVDASIAAGFGYTFGIVMHWLISTRFVFAAQAHEHGTMARSYQKVSFLASALLGLGATVGIVNGVVAAGMPLVAAKLAAIVVSFQMVWFLRRTLVFAEQTSR